MNILIFGKNHLNILVCWGFSRVLVWESWNLELDIEFEFELDFELDFELQFFFPPEKIKILSTGKNG